MSAERREPVLLHIQDAESWLSRAKTEYQAANDVRGELDLSLAQAEVKYAWELSRSGRKIPAAQPVAPRSMARWMLPLAACLGLGILAIAWPRLAGHRPEGSVAVRPQPVTVTAPQQAGLTKAPSSQTPSAATMRPSAAPPEILEQPPEEAPVVPVVPPAPTKSVVVAPESPSRQVVPPADNARPASSNNGTALDLDELARMAQETLTSGESVSGGQH